jgi:hypothetical protein
MVTSETTKFAVGSTFAESRVPAARRSAHRDHPVFAWLVLVGIFCPTVPIPIGDLTFTAGRLAIFLLFVPALVTLFRKDRARVASDYSAFACFFWILTATAFNDGYRPYVAAEAIEFLGAYLIGRAFFFGRPALKTFIRVFKFITVIVIMLALLDTWSGRDVIRELVATKPFEPGYRLGLVRAYSIFDGAELYGTFCVAAAAILLYSEGGRFGRALWVCFAALGVALSLSSGPLLGLIITLGTYLYDRILKNQRWRWKALVAGFGVLLVVLFTFAGNPIGWIIRNLTLDPWTGYWRVAEWDHALAELSKSPFVGFGISDWKNASRDFMIFVGEQGIDCVWLVEALRYGYPIVLLIGLTMFLPFFSKKASPRAGYMDDMRKGFSFVVVVLSIIGMTVHYWDSVWSFFSLCLGIRASFVEFESNGGISSVPTLRHRSRPAPRRHVSSSSRNPKI